MAIGTSALLRIMRRQRLYRSSSSPLLQPFITTAAALEELAAHLARAAARRDWTPSSCANAPTARSCAWCSWPRRAAAACVDPLALRAACAAGTRYWPRRRCVKVMHASRQDLEVLLPIAGVTRPVFDTQIARRPHGAAGADRLCRAGAAPARTRTAPSPTRAPTGRAGRSRPSRSPTPSMTCNYLLPLAERLQEELGRLGRLDWLQEELAELADPDAACPSIRSRPGSASRDCATSTRGACAWRARWPPGASAAPSSTTGRAAGSSMRPCCARSCCRCRARSEALEAIPEMPPGLVKRRGAELLALVAAAEIPEPPPAAAAPGAARSAQGDAAEETQPASPRRWRRELQLAPEVLATRRDLEQLADGRARRRACCAAGAVRCWASGCWRRSSGAARG